MIMIKSSSYINFNDAEGCFIIEDSIHAVFAFSTSSLVLVVKSFKKSRTEKQYVNSKQNDTGVYSRL
jgi:hypothetical protein